MVSTFAYLNVTFNNSKSLIVNKIFLIKNNSYKAISI